MQSPRFIQLIGGPGSGCRRLTLDLMQPAKSAAWISPRWNLYAPLLWKLADERGTRLLGIESEEKKNLRALAKTLFESQVFDVWILDGLKLSLAEGMFLRKLLQGSTHPTRVLVLDLLPHSFCQERAHIHLSHQNYRITWSKGRTPTPIFLPASLEI